MKNTAFSVANFLVPYLMSVPLFICFVAGLFTPIAYSQNTLCPQQSGKFSFVLTPTTDNDYIVGIADTVSAEETDNAAFIYMEVEGGRIFFAFSIYVNDNVSGMAVPYSVPIDSLVCIAVEKAVGGQITFYINERSYTRDSWVLRDDVEYISRGYNTNAWILSPAKSKGLNTSCANLLQTDTLLLFQEALLGLSDAFASQIKNSTLEAREPILFQTAILAVAPNPTSHFLSISVPKTVIKNSAKLVLTNAMGKQVVLKEWESIPQSISLDLAGLPVGTYLLQLFTEAQLFTAKFIKQ